MIHDREAYDSAIDELRALQIRLEELGDPEETPDEFRARVQGHADYPGIRARIIRARDGSNPAPEPPPVGIGE